MSKITFIGGGHMAAALVGGLRSSGFSPRAITVTDRLPAQLGKMREKFGVNVSKDNVAASKYADLIILAVKPQDTAAILAQLAPAILPRQPLILSIAAGIRVATICAGLNGFDRVVRAMPNRPALVRKGVTALFAPSSLAEDSRTLAEQVFRAVGSVVWVDREDLIDAATAISGSGPAYFFLLAELLEQAAQELGLPPQTARTLAVQTAYGAGCMAHEPGSNPAQLRAEVTSPGGTTAAAIKELENADLHGIVRRAVLAAYRRSAELSK